MIPVHNCAGYLALALKAVTDQLGERDDIEIIVVDDASSDDPAAVVERLGHGVVSYRPNPGHLGAIATFNRCLQLATGELVHLLHGDDSVLPGFYAAMERALTDTAALAAVCRAEDIDADDLRLHVTRSYRRGTGVWTDALESLAVSNRVRAPGIVVRRSAYEQVGSYRTDLPHAADWDMWVRLAASGPVIFVDQVLARYRRHAGSDTSIHIRTASNIRERVKAIGVIAGYLDPGCRRRTTRQALAYAAVFAGRTALRFAHSGQWSAAGRQAREAARCVVRLPFGVSTTPTRPAPN